MAKSNYVADIKAEVSSKILAALKAGDLPPWRKPWHMGGLIPRNGQTRKPYRGINILYLQAIAWAEGYQSQDWFTWNMAQKAGGDIKPDERKRSWYVIFWKWIKKKDAKDDYDTFPIMKYYRVYNREQTTGLPYTPDPVLSEEERIDGADKFITGIKKHDGLKVETGSKAAYYPIIDHVEMPPFKNFESAELFYATLYHEVAHWTGHKSRLNRAQEFEFTQGAYAAEELVAELASAFLCSLTNIDGNLQPAEYISSWIKLLENDKKAIFTAAGLAQKATDYLIDKSGVEFWEEDAPKEVVL